tara:strand:+ start:728 stop:2473 length:1746 start_codon:yes stop_codon:yes gene_type:complete
MMSRITPWIMGMSMVISLIACVPAEEAEESNIGVKLAALATCSTTEDYTGITSLSLKATVEGLDQGSKFKVSKSGNVSVGGSSFSVSGIPAGAQRVVTVSGTSDAGTELFARSRGVTVLAKEKTELDMLLVPGGDFGCLDVENSFGNVVFPATAQLPDGRVVIAGGYQAVNAQGTTKILTAPSDKVFIFDGRHGTFQEVPALMNHKRGAAGAVYLPGARRVVIFGGAQELRYEGGQEKFPFSVIGSDAQSTYDVMSLDAMEQHLADPTAPGLPPIFLDPPTEANGVPNRMMVARVFPRATRLEQDDAVLVTGGGNWPVDSNAGFIEVEYYHPDAFNGEGGFVDPNGALAMNTLRSGHSLTPLGVNADGFSVSMLWGGTIENSVVGEVFIQGSSSGSTINGVFHPLVVTGSVPPPPYFHSAARISDTKVLVVGGVESDGSQLLANNAARAYVLDYKKENGLHMVEVHNVEQMDHARYFGALGVTGDGQYATVIGGWAGDSAQTPVDVLFADLEEVLNAPPGGPMGTASFTPLDVVFAGRGGISAETMVNDALLLIGGVADPASINTSEPGAAETFIATEVYK